MTTSSVGSTNGSTSEDQRMVPTIKGEDGATVLGPDNVPVLSCLNSSWLLLARTEPLIVRSRWLAARVVTPRTSPLGLTPPYRGTMLRLSPHGSRSPYGLGG